MKREYEFYLDEDMELYVIVDIKFSVFGRYHPATMWDPPNYPEVSVESWKILKTNYLPGYFYPEALKEVVQNILDEELEPKIEELVDELVNEAIRARGRRRLLI